MKVPLILVLVGSVINLLLLGLGIVTAFFLRLVFPSIEWGTAVLTGLVSSASSICALCGILIVASRLEAVRQPGKIKRVPQRKRSSRASWSTAEPGISLQSTSRPGPPGGGVAERLSGRHIN